MACERIFFIVGAIVVLASTACKHEQLPYYNTPDFTPHWNNTSQTSSHIIPGFSFTDQNDNLVTNKTFDGKIYVANFFFTSCANVCPKMMKNLMKVQSAFPNNKQIGFLAHTVTPWVDSIARLKNYSNQYDMDNRWHLVTGDKATIYQLARRSYFAEEEPGFIKDSTEFLHTEHVLLIDKHKHIRGVYNGTLELEIDRLIEDIKILLKEPDNS